MPAPGSQVELDDVASLDEATPFQKLRLLPGSNDSAASFEVLEEDHTLANALRYMIMKSPNVDLCGYTILHPSDAKLNIRIQTLDGTSAISVMERALEELMDLCDVVIDRFKVRRDQFSQIQPN